MPDYFRLPLLERAHLVPDEQGSLVDSGLVERVPDLAGVGYRAWGALAAGETEAVIYVDAEDAQLANLPDAARVDAEGLQAVLTEITNR